jgi:hypothetical protein
MTAGSRRRRTSLHRGGGVVDHDDGGGSSSPWLASPHEFVHDALMEDGTTIARMDRNIEMDARLYVMWILCQMVEEAPLGVHNLSSARAAAAAAAAAEGGNLSVSGLILVLVARFNNLFCHATTANRGDGTGSPDADDGDRATEERMTGPCPASSGSKIEDGCRRLALAISDGPSPLSNNENKRSCLGPLLATYETVSWGASTYLLGDVRNALLLSGNACNNVHWWFYQSCQSFGGGNDGGGAGAGRSEVGNPGAEVNVGAGGGIGAFRHPCIEGCSATGHSDRGDALWTANCRSTASGRCSIDWDPMTMTQPFNLFFELL